jgi:hypothetical protein
MHEQEENLIPLRPCAAKTPFKNEAASLSKEKIPGQE